MKPVTGSPVFLFALKILQKTVELLQKHSVHGWNMDELSEQAGLSKNTLYKIIGSKEELMERFMANYYQKIFARMAEILEAGGDYFYTFRKLTFVYSDLSPTYFAEIFKEYPAIEEKIIAKYAALRQRLIDYIQRGVDEGYLRADLDAEKTFELLRTISLSYGGKFPEHERAENIHFAFECVAYGIVKK